MASAERVFEVLDEEEMVDEPSGIPVETDSPYRVSFEHVAFGYSPEKLLMKDFNLNVKPGEMVAIVGPTGAGKTTPLTYWNASMILVAAASNMMA